MTTEWAMFVLVVSMACLCVLSVAVVVACLEEYATSTYKPFFFVMVVIFSLLFVLCGVAGIGMALALRVMWGQP